MTQSKTKTNDIKNNPITLSSPATAITHNDLDGIGCATLFIKCFRDIKTHLVNTGDETIKNITAAINSAVDDHTIDTDIFIADLGVNYNETGIEFLKAVEAYNHEKQGKVRFFDHHVGSQWLKCMPWARVCTQRCAAYIVWDYLSVSFNLNDMHSFAAEVDKYDRWLEEKNIGTAWTLLIDELGPEYFLERAKNVDSFNYEKLTPMESEIISCLFSRKKRYIEKAMASVKFAFEYFECINSAVNVAVVHAVNYISEIGNLILDTTPETEVAYVINQLEGVVYMISRGNVKVADLAMERGGGGHARIAGFPCSCGFSLS